MFSDIYTPTKFQDLSFNSETTQKLVKIADKHELAQNIIFTGLRSSGKKTRLHCFLNALYQNSIHNKIKTQELNKNLEITYKVSKYHFEITPSNYGINDRTIITDFIAPLSSSINLANYSYKLFVIHRADKLSLKAQYALRNLIERRFRTARFILLVEDYNRLLDSLSNRFLVIRFRLPTDDEVLRVLKNIPIPANWKPDLEKIVAESKKRDGYCHLSNAINFLQLSIINQVQYIDPIFKMYHTLFQELDYKTRRNYIYAIYTANLELDFRIVYHYFGTEYIPEIAKYQLLQKKGNKIPLYLEVLLIHILGY